MSPDALYERVELIIPGRTSRHRDVAGISLTKGSLLKEFMGIQYLCTEIINLFIPRLIGKTERVLHGTGL